jgi:hypothetical protein
MTADFGHCNAVRSEPQMPLAHTQNRRRCETQILSRWVSGFLLETARP